jgi:site-specific DNA-methyltransferase (adenine-specific)
MLNVQYNPDVLTCLANLSSDEVFTPPSVANQVLDMLPNEIWSDETATFLDPVSKSGVFLREIAKRLLVGLEAKFPNLDARLEHIFTEQIYGIAITELTGLMSRRTVYCSKAADSEYSINKFNSNHGNIIFQRIEHSWKNSKCEYCGASFAIFSRGGTLETHAYQFIHTNRPEEIFKMKFDVIVGNPPYQLKDGGTNASAVPIYQKFVEQAKKLNPRYLTMITPSRWFGGGRGLSDYREEMLSDNRIRRLVDFELASDCFPGVDIAGGVSYFLWERDNPGDCKVTNIHKSKRVSSIRKLDEFQTFVRHSEAVPIIRKVTKKHKNFMNEQVSASKPFGLRTYERPLKKGDIVLKWQNGEGPFLRSKITTGHNLIDKWKVITAYVGYDHAGNPDKEGRRRVFSKIDILPPGTVCTETYLVVGAYKKQNEAENLRNYMKTRLFRFLVSQFMYSHHITKDAYSFVPVLKMTGKFDELAVMDTYQLTKKEIDFIHSKIKPME